MALVGNYREEHVFALTPALELYDVYQTKVTTCDKQIQAILTRLNRTPRRCEQLASHQTAASLARGCNDDHTRSPAFDVVVKGAGVKSDSSFLTFGS
jgi:hypothetical protein